MLTKSLLELSDKFEVFWKTIYPHRNNKPIAKVEAKLKWMKYIKPDDVPLIFQAGEEYAKSRDVKANIGIKDCHRWIRDGKGREPWRDWIPVKTSEQMDITMGLGMSSLQREKMGNQKPYKLPEPKRMLNKDGSKRSLRELTVAKYGEDSKAVKYLDRRKGKGRRKGDNEKGNS